MLGLLLYDFTFLGLPALSTYVAQRTERTAMASAFASVVLASSLGLLFSPALGGAIAQHWGIRSCFLLGFGFHALSVFIVPRTDRSLPIRRHVALGGRPRKLLRYSGKGLPPHVQKLSTQRITNFEWMPPPTLP